MAEQLFSGSRHCGAIISMHAVSGRPRIAAWAGSPQLARLDTMCREGKPVGRTLPSYSRDR